MSGRKFADTNIFIYAISDDADPNRTALAQLALLDTDVVSVQVLNEFVNVSRNKLRQSWEQVLVALEVIAAAEYDILTVTHDLHLSALDLSRRHQLRIYDACIVAAALEAGCDTLWSEDLQAGRQFDRLTVKNPFEAA
jgi:predicted nucleic acid-binding protein